MSWRISFLFALVVCVLGCNRSDPNAPPVLRNDAEFAEALARAENLSKGHILASERGESLSPMAEQELREAARLFGGLRAYRPGSIALNLGAGQVYNVLGEWDKADAPLRQAIISAGDSPVEAQAYLAAEAHYQLSVSEFYRQNYPAAEEQAREAVDLFFDIPKYHVALAQALVQQEKLAEAKEHLSVAIATDPENRPAKSLLDFVESAEQP